MNLILEATVASNLSSWIPSVFLKLVEYSSPLENLILIFLFLSPADALPLYLITAT